MKQLFLCITLFCVINCWAQGIDSLPVEKLIIRNVSFLKSGLIEWSTAGEKANTKFVIEERRWDHWIPLTKLDSKGIGNNTYAYLADTACVIYAIRIRTDKNYSSTENYPNPVNVSYKGGGNKPIYFSHKTKFELYDMSGNLLLHGCDNKVDLRNLKRGDYYLNYGNSAATILKYD